MIALRTVSNKFFRSVELTYLFEVENKMKNLMGDYLTTHGMLMVCDYFTVKLATGEIEYSMRLKIVRKELL